VKEVEIDEGNRRVKRLLPLRLTKSLRRQGENFFSFDGDGRV